MKYVFHKTNGFGQITETIKARDLNHALRIMAQRCTNTRKAHVRKDSATRFTLFGRDGYNLGGFTLVTDDRAAEPAARPAPQHAGRALGGMGKRARNEL